MTPDRVCIVNLKRQPFQKFHVIIMSSFLFQIIDPLSLDIEEFLYLKMKKFDFFENKVGKKNKIKFKLIKIQYRYVR